MTTQTKIRFVTLALTGLMSGCATITPAELIQPEIPTPPQSKAWQRS